MKLAVPTNFQDDFLTRLPKEYIHYIYGKLAADFVGGGRPSFMLPHISKRHLEKHVEKIHKNGLKFNYLLNAFCMAIWNSQGRVSGRSAVSSTGSV